MPAFEALEKSACERYVYLLDMTFKTEDLSKERDIDAFELITEETDCFEDDLVKPVHQAAGACERNGQAYRNYEPDHNISLTCCDKFTPWFIVIFANELYYIDGVRAVLRPSLEPAL